MEAQYHPNYIIEPSAAEKIISSSIKTTSLRTSLTTDNLDS